MSEKQKPVIDVYREGWNRIWSESEPLKNMVDVYCQNCGYESHCGSIKYREERNWKDERIGEIEVCKSCRCVECTESDPRPVGQPFRKNL